MNRGVKSLFILFFAAAGSLCYCQTAKKFSNPILAGFYPDPSICKAGGNYYLVNSTFAYFPGITVFTSSDLAHWKQLGYVLDRPGQLKLDGHGVSRGIFAPAIRFNKGIFYVTCTLVDGGGNFVVTAKDPAGPWSDPVWIPQVNGIDPSLFFDDNGKAYLLYNSVSPDNKPLYDGHRTIRMYEFDIANLKVVGEEKTLINGGTDLSKKPVWIEGPHIFKKDGYYYLIAAEGGTGFNHSEVVFRSSKVEGPYISYEKNPILTQRHLDPSRKNPITSAGHADFVETESGDWWSVFLGCRPYTDDYYNIGRETFLAPVKWKDGWPVINPDFAEVQYQYSVPINSSTKIEGTPYSGNFIFNDEFDKDKLDLRWTFLREPVEKWYNLNERKGYLSLQLRPQTCSEKVNPSFVGHRQQHINSIAITSVDFIAQSKNEKAGLLLFQNENHFYFLCKSTERNQPVVQVYKSTNGSQMELIAFQKIESNTKNELKLKIETAGDLCSFSFSSNADEWILLQKEVDAKFLSTKIAGGFVGSVYALYATSQGQPSVSKAYFNWFNYEGKDDVYK